MQADAGKAEDNCSVLNLVPPPGVSTLQPAGFNPLQTLTSGRRREVRDGAFQAHTCVVASAADVSIVMEAFQQADGFRSVANWSYAYRVAIPALSSDALPAIVEDGPLPISHIIEGFEDGLDEGCGEKVLAVMRRFALQGLLLVVSRWQGYGVCCGLDLFGTELYAIVVERCKDLILNLQKAVGWSQAKPRKVLASESAPPGPKPFDFSHLPRLPEPRAPTKFGPNHFLSDMALKRAASLPSLLGGDVRLWMANDRCLRQLPDSELRALRSLRQPDPRVERVLRAVAVLRGQASLAAGAPAARWGHLLQVLRSATLRTELLLFDASSVSTEAAGSALQLLEGLDVEEVRRANSGAAALLEWALGVVRWCREGPQVASAPLRPRQSRGPLRVEGSAPPPPGGAAGPSKARARLRCPVVGIGTASQKR